MSVFSVQVLVTALTDRGFLFLLSSVQMATPPGKTWGTWAGLLDKAVRVA